MAKIVQRRRGTTAEHSTFTGALGELTVDSTKDTVVVHDGAAAGGYPLLREDGSNSALAVGSAGTPSLKFTGDPNTGLYSPGADQVAISTGGTGRLFVDASGRVGIGEQSPAELFEARDGNIALDSSGASVGARTTERFYKRTDNGSSNGMAAIGMKGVGTNGFLGEINFYTGLSDVFNSALQSRMVITSAGLVGIGTSSPSEKLSVIGGNIEIDEQVAGRRIGFDLSSNFTPPGGNVTADYGLTYQPSADLFSLGLSGFTSLNFYTNRAERLRIDSAGRVGIGTTSPSELLHVAGGARFGANDTSTAYLEVGTGATGNRSAFIDLTGDTTYSDFGLRVSRGNSGADTNSELRHRGTGALILNAVDSGSVAFRTGDTERARIDSSGRLLVGTSSARTNFVNTSASAAFQVEGLGNGRNVAVIGDDNSIDGAYLVLAKQRSGSVGGNTIVQSGDIAGSILFEGSDGTEFVDCASIQAFVDGTPGANDMPGRLVFSTTADGAASPTERMRITSAGVLQIADAGNIAVGTTTGTKIGTATTQKLGFYNATPVVQPAAVTNATDAASVITQLNDLLAKLRTLGIIAT